MPRGTIPRQPSKAGRQDKAKTARVAAKPRRSLRRESRPSRPRSPRKAPCAKGYNPLAPERVDEILKRLDERYPA